jgi:RHS repeat-associated protein
MSKSCRLRKVGLSCFLTLVFTAGTFLPPSVRPAYAAGDANQPAPLPVPEDPLGQKPEQQIPEISTQVDVRDAHLVARVVDIWGPGRTSFVVRSYTNVESSSTSAAGGWQFNQHLDLLQVTLPGGSTGFQAREPEGNRTLYKYSSTRYDATQANRWDVYVNDIGVYSTMELHSTCQVVGGQQQCTWDGLYMVYLPKGVTRRFAANGVGFGLIQQISDASGNVTNFTWTSLPSQVRAYVASVTDPVGRVTTYTYEQAFPEGTLWHYRVKSITDPYGRTAVYTYDAANHLMSSQNAAGRITTYGYNSRGLLVSVTNPRGYTTSVGWSGGGALWFDDNFKRPDSSTIVAPGTSWVEVKNQTSAIQIVSNAVQLHGYTGGSFNAQGVAYWNSVLSDQYSELQGNLGGDNREGSYVVVRVGAIRAPFIWNNGNSLGMGGGYGLQYNALYAVVQLIRYGEFDGPEGGTVLASAALPGAGAYVISKMRVEAIGNKIRGVVYGNRPSITLEATDGTYASGSPGLAAGVSPGAGGFISGGGWRWDSWAGGAPPQVTTVTLTEGGVTNYSYNSATLTTTVTDALGHQTTSTANSAGDVLSVTNPLGQTMQYAYDAHHNVTSVTDALGNVTTYAYNSRNKITQIVQASGTLNLTTNFTWDGNDNLLSVTNPRGIRTDYMYDPTNNLISVRRAVGTANETLIQYTYTPWGGVASLADPRGNTTTYAYTARHQVQTVAPPAGGATSFGYDAMDDQVTMTNGNGRTWTTTYDASRLVTGVTDPLGNSVRYAYDANGNRTNTTDAKNQATTFTYDTRDRLVTITDPLNGSTRYQYDAVGNLTSLTNALNVASSFVYDAANRRIQVTDGLRQTTAFGYDAVGNRTSMRDRKGTTYTYSYDQVNRVIQISAGGIIVSYTYDANGNRLTMVDPTGTSNFAYDFLDRLTRTAYPDGRSVQFTYDNAGNRTGLTYPGGTASLAYTYDAVNRLIAVAQGTLQWTFGYDGAGNRASFTEPNGTTTAYTYLTNNWLASVTHTGPGGVVLQAFSYTYDANGNRIGLIDPLGATTSAYDALNRLTQAAYPAGYGTWAWTYDPVGNRTQQVAPSGTTLYTYDANNRLIQAGAVVYTYDANGNMIRSSIGEQGVYDPFNRLIQVTGQNGTATYTYNGDGLKVKRVGPDGATLYYHDGFRAIWETDAVGNLTNELERDIFGNLLGRREGSGARRYVHSDGLGSTTALTDEAGAVTASVLYDAWGAVRIYTNPTLLGKYLFTGAEAEGVMPLYHMGARFYAPTLGRWLSEDPAQGSYFEPMTLNFYAYVQNNPMRWIDPNGLDGCDLGCLNEQRQDAARQTLNLPEEQRVGAYMEYREAAQALGHETAMDLLRSFVSAQLSGVSSGYVATASGTGPTTVTFDQVRSGYVVGAGLYRTGITNAALTIIASPNMDPAITRTNLGIALAQATRGRFMIRDAYRLDVRFFNKEVYASLGWLDRRTVDFVMGGPYVIAGR